ncbi:hypothetical protein HYW42_04630 [Candidatus Daviesbacteria bacterium]|nr:hypothetical protein [Candidatus Daviesbacteria bacterium]
MSAEQPTSQQEAIDAWTGVYRAFVYRSHMTPKEMVAFGFNTDRVPETRHINDGVITTMPVLHFPNTRLPRVMVLMILQQNITLATSSCIAHWVDDKPVIEQVQFSLGQGVDLTHDALVRSLIATGIRLEQPDESL